MNPIDTRTISGTTHQLLKEQQGPMRLKYRSVDAKLYDELVREFSDLIGYAEEMVYPSVQKQFKLDGAREVLKRARAQDYERQRQEGLNQARS